MLDTNILLDWLLRRDTARVQRIEKLFARSEQLYIPDAILVETAFALQNHYDMTHDEVAVNLYRIVEEPLFGCNRSLFRRAIAEYAAHPAWSFLDTCLLHYAEAQGVSPVWTFDKKLVSQSSGRAKSPV